jgi:hypothetical protein
MLVRWDSFTFGWSAGGLQVQWAGLSWTMDSSTSTSDSDPPWSRPTPGLRPADAAEEESFRARA